MALNGFMRTVMRCDARTQTVSWWPFLQIFIIWNLHEFGRQYVIWWILLPRLQVLDASCRNAATEQNNNQAEYYH